MATLVNSYKDLIHDGAIEIFKIYCGTCGNESKFANSRGCWGCKIRSDTNTPTNYIRKIVKDCNTCETLDCNTCEDLNCNDCYRSEYEVGEEVPF